MVLLAAAWVAVWVGATSAQAQRPSEAGRGRGAASVGSGTIGSGTSRADGEVTSAQEDLRQILEEVQARMVSLSQTLKESQPGDAKRLDEAAQKIKTSQLPQDLETILENLKREKFFAALNLQDSALRKLEEIIRILEARRLAGEDDLKRKLATAEALRQKLSQARRAEEGLLNKTREFLKRLADLGSLESLGDQVAGLAKDQESLERGEDLSARDPESDDSRELERAREMVEGLRRDQEALNKLLEKLAQEASRPGAREKSPAEGTAPDGNPRGGEALREVRARMAELAQLWKGTRKASGLAEAPAEPGEEKGTGPEKRAGEEIPPGERGRLREAAREIAGKLRDLGKSLSRPAQAVEDRPQALEAVKEAGARVEESEKEIEKGDGRSALAQEERGLEALRAAERALAPGEAERSPEPAREAAEAAARQSAIAEATRRTAGELRAGAERAGNPRAGESQEAGARALDEARKAMEMAQKALEGSLPEGSPAPAEASPEPKKGTPSPPGTSSQGGGSRRGQEASRAGLEAAQKLAEAAKALERGARDLAARSGEEKAADLQRKLSRKTEEAAREAKRLERKLKSREPNLSAAGRSLSEAARSMRDSSQARRAGQREEAKAKAREALERLRKAREELRKEDRDQLARMERRRLKEEAREQERIKEMTRRLAQEMAESQDSSSRAKGVEEAAGSMQEAQEKLEASDALGAEEKEEQALERLQEAEDEAREEEDRLARLKQEQELLNIVAELVEIKDQQEKLNASVVELDRERGKGPRPPRPVMVLLRERSQEEAKLGERVEGLTSRLEEEIARVFAYVLKNIGADMMQISDALAGFETGRSTQFLGQEVVNELERLMDSLRKLKPQSPSGGGSSGEGEIVPPLRGRRRLVPPRAELIMLKELQVEVNRRTRELETQREAAGGEVWERALKRLVQKQGSVTDMTRKIAEDVEGRGPQEEAPLEGEEGAPEPGGKKKED